MRILEVISETPPVKSGVSRVAEKLVTGLSVQGYTVDTLSLKDVPRVEWGEVRLSSMPWRLKSLKSRFSQYDLVHLHGPVPTFSDVFLLWGLRGMKHHRPKLVYTYHAPVDLRVFPITPFIKVYNQLQEKLSILADHVVVTTPSYGQKLSRSVPPHKLSVIPWGVDYDRFYASPAKNGPFTILYLGQVRPYKGLPVLLNAVKGLDNLRVWVIGDGHFAETCKRQAKELELENVTFWGRLPDEQVTNMVRDSHALVLPSVTRSEAFGIVLLEGMSAGSVPIASHLPGVADLVGNEGFTFPPGDAGALRAILSRLQLDEDLRVHMASLAQAKASLYSWDRVIFGYDRIFQNLTGLTPVRPADTLLQPLRFQPDVLKNAYVRH